MIKAEITSGDNSYMATIKGHADYAPKGLDIVCAGVSALSMALMESVTVMLNRKDAAYYSAEVNDGSFELRIFGIRSEEVKKTVHNLFFMLKTGLEQIERDFPGHLILNMFDFPFEGNDNDTSEQTMNNERREVKG